MTANELSSTTRQHVLGDKRQDNKKAAPVSVWSAWYDHEMNMNCPEQQTSSKQLRSKRGNNAFFEGMYDSNNLA
jgi:hypothetical protein